MMIVMMITRLPQSSGGTRSSKALVREIDSQEITIGVLWNSIV
jgi:hypothetical protein